MTPSVLCRKIIRAAGSPPTELVEVNRSTCPELRLTSLLGFHVGRDMSARHAGFASVITIDGGLVNEMLSAASAIFPAPSFSLPDVVTVGSDEIGIAGSVSFLTPTLSFAANPENLIGVAAGVVGLLQLTVNGADAIEVQRTLTFSLNVGLFIDVSPSSIALGPDFSDATVTSGKHCGRFRTTPSPRSLVTPSPAALRSMPSRPRCALFRRSRLRLPFLMRRAQST